MSQRYFKLKKPRVSKNKKLSLTIAIGLVIILEAIDLSIAEFGLWQTNVVTREITRATSNGLVFIVPENISNFDKIPRCNRKTN